MRSWTENGGKDSFGSTSDFVSTGYKNVPSLNNSALDHHAEASQASIGFVLCSYNLGAFYFLVCVCWGFASFRSYLKCMCSGFALLFSWWGPLEVLPLWGKGMGDIGGQRERSLELCSLYFNNTVVQLVILWSNLLMIMFNSQLKIECSHTSAQVRELDHQLAEGKTCVSPSVLISL